jgi:hypothetical protein
MPAPSPGKAFPDYTPDGVRRNFMLDLRNPRWDPLFAFHREVMSGTPIQDCVRELIAQGLGNVAENREWIEGRRIAINATRKDALTRMAVAIAQVAKDLDAMAASEAKAHDGGGLGSGGIAA